MAHQHRGISACDCYIYALAIATSVRGSQRRSAAPTTFCATCGGTAIQINDYEVLGSSQDGDDHLYDVKYIGPQTFTVRARWSRLGSEWKIVDADIIARD
jgi:hypothetical protein